MKYIAVVKEKYVDISQPYGKHIIYIRSLDDLFDLGNDELLYIEQRDNKGNFIKRIEIKEK